MSPRARVTLAVATIAVAAAGLTVVATVLTRSGTPTEIAQPSGKPRAGTPPLVLDLGVRTDPEARALRRAAALHSRKRYLEAGKIFGRYDSVEARIGAALSTWPQGFERLSEIARERPENGAGQLALGLGLFWRGDDRAARAAWRQAKSASPDSLYAIRAGDFLNPEYPVPGLPVFVPGFPSPSALDRLAPPAQLAFLRRSARAGSARERLLYGVALQHLGRPLSAEKQFRAAAALAPRDPEALTAAAVGLFDKDRPSRAFSRLGRLTRRYPKAATVRFHLGLLLLWLGQVDEAKRQLRLARAAEPGSIAARQAGAFLRRLPAQR
jgi:tetratricopeptide (TPR) repeat protein